MKDKLKDNVGIFCLKIVLLNVNFRLLYNKKIIIFWEKEFKI